MTDSNGFGGVVQGQLHLFFTLKRLFMPTINLSSNTVSKLYYFDNRVRSFYEKHGFHSVPFDGREVQEMIKASQQELSSLFLKIWGSSMGYHLLDKFHNYRGNIYEFFMCLDGKNRDLFTSTDW